MKLTPLDLRQYRFRRSFRGFDRTEVVALLTEVADDYERALRETDRLGEDLRRMEAVLSEHRELERNLRNTLLTAQKLADEIREHAQQEGQRIIREAQGRADLLVQKMQGRIDEIQREIDALKLRRRDVETMVESTISGLRNALEFVRAQDSQEREEKLLLLRPWQGESAVPTRLGVEEFPAEERKIL